MIYPCKDYLNTCDCRNCLNYVNFFGTQCDTKSIAELSSCSPYVECIRNRCRKCYCGMYEPCDGQVGCLHFVLK